MHHTAQGDIQPCACISGGSLKLSQTSPESPKRQRARIGGIIISKIKVIDAPCGSGKTSWAIQEMNAHTEESYIYCTPFLDEIDRIRDACGRDRFPEPKNWDTTKLNDFNNLIASGTDIAVTHSTFLNSTDETMELVKDGEYTLIIDEALDAIVNFNSTPFVENDRRQETKAKDVEYLINKGSIKIGENKRVIWMDEDGTEADKFTAVARLAKAGRLFYAQDRLLVCIFPPKMFSCFKEIYIMTYLFGGSLLKCYFDLFGIEYEVINVKMNDDGVYSLCEYDHEAERAFRDKCKSLITVCDNNRLNKSYKKAALSATWYDNNVKDKSKMKQIQNDLRYFFETVAQAKSKDIMWTCSKRAYKEVKHRGYICVRQLTVEEMQLPKKKREALEKRLNCFVPLNARASNEYADRWALAYFQNMNMQPQIEQWLRACGIEVAKDLFSLSCLIQWVFRSRIRKDETIILYLPSPRMRQLFTDWLNYEI